MNTSLDEYQLRVIAGGISERRIVVAGPGTGKTATSVALIEEFARSSNEGVVLFLSFSRSAMRAAFAAFGEQISDVPIDVHAMTLDSLAWQLTDQESPGEDHRPPNFDEVVRSAEVKLNSAYEGEVDEVVHLIVDEAQDMSAPRRALLGALIDRLPEHAGVTIFGDPLQSIYEFFDGDHGESMEPGWSHLVDDLTYRSITTTYELSVDHRARRRGPKKVATASAELRRRNEGAERAAVLEDLLVDLPRLDFGGFVVRASEWKGTSAVLMRTNAEVAETFSQLTAEGVPCVWREPGRADPRIAPWVAELWSEVGEKPLTVELFAAFAAARPEVEGTGYRELLRHADQRGRVDWAGLARSLRVATEPTRPWFADHDRSTNLLTVSTIHQAKGLEWDNVAVIGPDELLIESVSGTREPELLFVAVSRARDRVTLLDWKMPYTRRGPGPGQRVYRPQPGRRVAAAICVTPEDLVIDRQSNDAEAQHVLAKSRPNERMEFDLLASGHAEWPTYRCRVGSTIVGITSPAFGRCLAAVAPRGLRQWPLLGPVFMDGVEARFTIGDQPRFWLQPRPFGMAEVIPAKGEKA